MEYNILHFTLSWKHLFGPDDLVIYSLNEEALAKFDEFDEQICSRLNSSWQTGNLMTRATKERRHVIRWSVILFILYQYSRRGIFKAFGPIAKRIPPRYVKYAVKLNEYFQKQKEIIEKVYYKLFCIKGVFHLRYFRTKQLFCLVYI